MGNTDIQDHSCYSVRSFQNIVQRMTEWAKARGLTANPRYNKVSQPMERVERRSFTLKHK
jgi:hypothetical protein